VGKDCLAEMEGIMKDYIKTGDTNVEKMKGEYQNIPLPKNLEERVRQGITQAKEEVHQSKVFYLRPSFWAKSGGCIAAAMAAFVLLVNFNAPIAHAMSNIPVLNSIVQIVSFHTFEDDTKEMHAEVNVPEVEVKDASDKTNESATKELNDKIKEYTSQIIKEYKKDVKTFNGEGREEVRSDYKVVTNNARLFSLRFDTEVSLNTSGVTVKIYHVDKADGKSITIEDIFKKDSGYLDAITSEIKRQMRRQMAEDDQVMYFIDSTDMPEDDWKGLTKDANFYINDKGEFVVVFDKYEVAPGYMGAREFTIPSEVIKDSIKPEYL